jgi:hypothetical protein
MGAAAVKTTRRVYPNLVAFFNQTGMTTTALAGEFGISVPLMSAIKWRQREPNLALAMEISDRCGVPLESLILVKRRRVS